MLRHNPVPRHAVSRQSVPRLRTRLLAVGIAIITGGTLLRGGPTAESNAVAPPESSVPDGSGTPDSSEAAEPTAAGGAANGSTSPDFVAGRSLQEYASDLNSDLRTVRLRALRSLRPFGSAAGSSIRTCLSHADPAMRYLAAVALGDLGEKAVTPSIPDLQKMVKKDASLSVQMAAAYALCQAGHMDDHLPLLIQRVRYPERGMACSAAELIGKLGPKAKMATEELLLIWEANKPKSPGDYHVGGAAKNALRKLGAVD
ncbi:MAG: HEAT repeat domain-containing protein [Planctomycetota bacterium]